MEKRNIWRSLTAGLLLAAIVLAAPLMLTTSDGASAPGPSTPTILLDGMSLRLDEDGNIQAYIDVWTRGIVKTHGTVFYLKYNPEWLEPSDYYTNEVIPSTGGMKAMTEGEGANNFFVYNPDLYIKEYADGHTVREMPFSEVYTDENGGNETYYRQLDNTQSNDTANMMQLTLYLDRYRLIDDFAAAERGDYAISGNVFQGNMRFGEGESSRMEILSYLAAVDDSGNEVAAPENTSIKLGTLSFRVTSREALRDMVEKFGGDTRYWFENSVDATNSDAPVYADATMNPGSGTLNRTYKYPWRIWAYVEYNNTKIYRDTSFNVPNGVYGANKAAAEIRYDFGHELISAELLRPEITINAYRAYSEDGTTVTAAHANVAAALQKYSPTVVASYADMRVQNFTMNWGAANTAERTYDFTVYERYTGTDVTIDDVLADPDAYPTYHVHYDYSIEINDTDGTATEVRTPSLWRDISTIPGYTYDPTHGDYIATQYFYYTNGETDELTHAPIYYRYPNPMEAHLKVTPVTVIGIGTDGLEKRYTMSEAQQVQSTDGLELPGSVRILTDVISGAPGLYLDIGSDGAHSLPGWLPATSNMTELHPTKTDGTLDTTVHWPTPDGTANGAGNYMFALGTENTVGTTTTVTPYPEVLHGDIRAKYPWLTSTEDYPIEALRRVAGENEPVHVYRVKWDSTTAASYMPGQDDYTNDNLTLNLAVTHNEQNHVFGAHAAFRVRMPNGKLIETGSGETPDGGSTPTDWFAADSTSVTQDNASYVEDGYSGDFNEVNYTNARRLSFQPGRTAERESTPSDDVTKRQFVDERAELRRMINLGGYFEISINEDTTDSSEVWSEYYPVYVPPRENDYEENKEYNFIGLNAGLFDYRGSVSDTLTFPRGEYYPIETSSTNPNTFRAETEDYGVLTTYDGETGDQPGRTYTFRVRHSQTAGVVWDTINDTTLSSEFGTVTKYNSKGDNDFADFTYNGFGKVINPTGDPHEPVLRFAEEGKEKPVESLHLIYEGTEILNVLSEPRGAYNEVTDVIFDTQTEGYIVRQSFVLTLLNAGTTDIDGIYIDTDTDINIPPYNVDAHGAPSYASHFYISDKPASFLAAGCKTTFTVTYVYDLRSADNGGAFDYLDKLYVCSNRSGTAEYLCEFDAHFTVTRKAVNRVTVIVLPPFVNNTGETFDIGGGDIAPGEQFYLGEAGVIGGLPLGADGQPTGVGTMDYTYGSSMRTAGEQVYIGTFPYEEYEVEAVLRTETGALIPLQEMGDYEGVYDFTMPSRNVTVYVIFREPTISKLRPAEINIYAGETVAEASDRTIRDDTRKTMWQKSFTDAEIAASTNPTTKEINNMSLMRGGKAAADSFNASVAHYLVVLEYEEAYVQAEALLRKVIAISDPSIGTDLARAALREIGYDQANTYENLDINNIDIDMTVYRYQSESMVDEDSVEKVYSSDGTPPIGDDIRDDGGTRAGKPGDTSVPTRHTSTVFESPTWGAREWLVITLGYDDPGVPAPASRVERSYYIELVRRPSYSVTKNYGNSPVGMIYNTKDFRDDGAGNIIPNALNADGTAALGEFERTRSFVGLADLNPALGMPYAIEKSGSGIDESYIYNREAWVGKGLLYDPDSLTSVDTYYVGFDRNGVRTSDIDEVDEYVDLDLDPYSLFVLLGQDFDDPGLEEIKDSSMRSVEPERVRRYIADVALLDESATTQVGRFDGATETAEDGSTVAKTVDIELGTLADDMHLESAFWQATHSYTQATYNYQGVPYPVYVDSENTTREYFLYDGSYWDTATQTQLKDDEVLERLEEKLIDHPTEVTIRPGVYTLVYEFKDFDSVVDDTREPLRETRKIVILGRVGDVNADDFVENDASYAAKMGDAAQTVKPSGSDESTIEKRVYDPLGQGSLNVRDENVIKFRTADVNNDRDVNNIDANALHSALDSIKQFYEPSGYSNLPTAGTGGGGSR